MVRCKFICQSIKKTITRVKDEVSGEFINKPIFTAEFVVVGVVGSPENAKFFMWTPSGKLEVGQYKEDLFEVGKEYYLDISPAV